MNKFNTVQSLELQKQNKKEKIKKDKKAMKVKEGYFLDSSQLDLRHDSSCFVRESNGYFTHWIYRQSYSQ